MLKNAQVTNPADYGCDYFAIETRHDELGYAVPAWEEMGHADLCGPFATAEEAQAALDLERSVYL